MAQDLTQIYGPLYGGLLTKQGIDTAGSLAQNQSLQGTMGLLSQMAKQAEQNKLIQEQVNIAKLKAVQEQQFLDMFMGGGMGGGMGGNPEAALTQGAALGEIGPTVANAERMMQKQPQAAPGSNFTPNQWAALAYMNPQVHNAAFKHQELAQKNREFNELSAAQKQDVRLRESAQALDVQKLIADLQKWNGLSGVERFNVQAKLTELQDQGINVNALIGQAAQQQPTAPQPTPPAAPGGQLQFPSTGRAAGPVAEQLQRDAGTLGDMSSESALRGAVGAPAAPGAPPLSPRDARAQAAASASDARELAAKREAELPQAQYAFRSSVTELDRLIAAAESVRDHAGLKGNFGLQGAFGSIPGGPSANAAAALEQLRTQIGQQTLSAMRKASPTGGAVGNVTEKEWPRLENALVALQSVQSLDQAKKNLNSLITIAKENKNNITEAFNTAYPRGQREQILPGPAAAPGRNVVDYGTWRD